MSRSEKRKHSPRDEGSRRNVRNADVADILRTLVDHLGPARQPQGTSQSFRGDAVPEFDPENRDQNVEKWSNKIDELRDVFGWSEETTIYYALAKLRGLAKTWYESLPTVKFSWGEWKKHLFESFPSKRDYCDTLDEMMKRNKRPNESFIRYYYEKLSLLNLCKISGKDAVSCLIGGLDPSLRNTVRAGNYASPEELLSYLHTVQEHLPAGHMSHVSRGPKFQD